MPSEEQLVPFFYDFGMSRPGIEPVTSRSPERTLYQLSYRGLFGIFSCKICEHYFSQTEMFTSNIQFGYPCLRAPGWFILPSAEDLGQTVSSVNSYCTINLAFTAAGVVPYGGRKTSARTSTIVQFIFYF